MWDFLCTKNGEPLIYTDGRVCEMLNSYTEIKAARDPIPHASQMTDKKGLDLHKMEWDPVRVENSMMMTF